MKTIKAVLFDLDDTLQDSYQARIDHMAEICRMYNIEYDEELYKQHYGRTKFDELLKICFGDKAEYVMLLTEIEEIYHRYIPSAHNGAVELLKYLTDQDIPTGIISSGSSGHFETKMNQLRVHNFFYIQTGSDHIHKKPDPRVFDVILDKLAKKKISSSEVLFVGDHEVDLLAAHHAGLQFAGLRTGPHRHALEDINENHGYLIFDDLHDLGSHYFDL